jgi:threonine dehydrogenase-like Zn-dependent dehydrogenase
VNITRLEGNVRVRLIDAPPPHPGEGEVVVQTAVSALCGSELHSYGTTGVDSGNSGHEAVGTVAEIGAGVTNLSIGQRVGVHAIAGCGSCSHCQAGRFTWCGSFRFYGNMHAERFLAAAASCYPLPDDVSWEAGVLLTGDGFGVPYHTSRKIASPDIGTVAIFGAGPIGLGNLILQRYLGRRVIAIDIAPYRLQTARTLGAETVDASNPDDSAASAVRRLTDGVGADVCIEAAGRPETAYACF